MKPETEKRLTRIQATIKFLHTLPTNTKVAAGDLAGFIEGYHGEEDLPEDEIETFKNPAPQPPAENKNNGWQQSPKLNEHANTLVKYCFELPDDSKISVQHALNVLKTGEVTPPTKPPKPPEGPEIQ